MYGVTFSHPNPDVGTLSLRLPPTEVSWAFKLNTSVQDTVGGQVIQILSIGYENFVIQGQFGWEGPHGFRTDRQKNRTERPASEFFSLAERHPSPSSPHIIGLTQMVEYFRRYFAVATQGGEANTGDSFIRGQYNQKWMTVSYRGNVDDYERSWTIYPTSFPSYRRANDAFAPEWRLEAQVVEPDFTIRRTGMISQLKALRANTGYKAMNPFSDPLAASYDTKTKAGQKRVINLTLQQLDDLNNNVLDYYGGLIGQITPDTAAELINMGASLPAVYHNELQKLKK